MAEQLMIKKKPPTYSSLRDYCYVVFRHKWKALLIFSVIFTAATSFVLLSTDTYRSEAKLLVRLGWESVNVDPTATTGERAGSVHQPQTIQLNTVLDILKSQALAGEIVDRIGPETFSRPLEYKNPYNSGAGSEKSEPILVTVRNFLKKAKDEAGDFVKGLITGIGSGRELSRREKAIGILMNSTEAQLLRNTHIISIAYTAQIPELAQDVVKVLTDLYLEKHKLVYRNPGSYEFLNEQYQKSRAEVDRIESHLRDLKKENGIVSVEQRLDFVETHALTIKKELNQATADLASSAAKIADLKKKLAALPERQLTGESTSKDFSTIDSLLERLHSLRNEEQEALAKFTDDSEPVRVVRRKIAEVRELLKNEKPREIKLETWGINMAHQEVESSLRAEETALISMEAKTGELKKQLVLAEKERGDLLDMKYRFCQLELDLSKEKENFSQIAKKLNHASMEQTLEDKRISSVSIIQPATFPLQPEDSKKIVVLLVGFIGGLVGAGVLVFVFESMDHTFKTLEEVEENLQIPVLVAIPRGRVNKISIPAEMKEQTNASA